MKLPFLALILLSLGCSTLPETYNPYVEYGTITPNQRGQGYEVITFGFSPSWAGVNKNEARAFAQLASDEAREAFTNLAKLEVSKAGTLTLVHDKHPNEGKEEKGEKDIMDYSIYALIVGFVGLVSALIAKVTGVFKGKKLDNFEVGDN